MTDIDPERRQQIRAKYGMDNPPDPNNPIANAMLSDGPRLVSKMFNWRRGTDPAPLWDPTQCPEMHAIATRAHRGLRIAMAAGEVECLDGHGEAVDIESIDDAATLVNFVGSQVLCVVPGDQVGHFASEYRATSGANVRKHGHAICQVRLAPECGGVGEHQRTMEFWPWLCEPFLLMFVICPACRDRAIAIADDGRKLGDIAAHELAADAPLPPWAARTDPGTDSGGGVGR